MGCAIAQQAHQVGQAGGRQRCVLAHHQVDQRGGAPGAGGGAVVGRRVGDGLVDARAAVTALDAQQAAVVHAVEQLRAGAARAAPVVLHASVREMLLHLARMHGAALAHEGQHLGGLALCLGIPGLAGLARVHQRQVPAGQKAVVDQAVLVDRQARVAAFQVAGAVVLDAVAQRQVLRPGRRADRVCLHKAQALYGRRQGGRREQGARHGMAAQVVKARFGGHGLIGARPCRRTS